LQPAGRADLEEGRGKRRQPTTGCPPMLFRSKIENRRSLRRRTGPRRGANDVRGRAARAGLSPSPHGADRAVNLILERRRGPAAVRVAGVLVRVVLGAAPNRVELRISWSGRGVRAGGDAIVGFLRVPLGADRARVEGGRAEAICAAHARARGKGSALKRRAPTWSTNLRPSQARASSQTWTIFTMVV
jgi:hypothetical protein